MYLHVGNTLNSNVYTILHIISTIIHILYLHAYYVLSLLSCTFYFNNKKLCISKLGILSSIQILLYYIVIIAPLYLYRVIYLTFSSPMIQFFKIWLFKLYNTIYLKTTFSNCWGFLYYLKSASWRIKDTRIKTILLQTVEF